MKRLLSKILLAVLAFTLVVGGFSACSEANWNGTTLKNWGAVKANTVGGFVAETENYVYFINGTGSYAEDNNFGTPVKGALAAIEKSKLGSEDAVPQIVVPKLFVATDFNAGVYIYGDYVYYATPNTNKNASGNVANTVLTFSRTKLDGSVTETYFDIEGLSTEYRIIESGDVVYIVYIDASDETNAKLVSYNTSSKTAFIISEGSEEADESLGAYKFVDNTSLTDAAVMFTTTVYSEEYDENASSRSEADYNRVYAYKVGEEKAKLVLDGGFEADGVTEKKVPETYTLSLVKNGYLFYTVSDGKDFTDDAMFGVAISDLYAKNSATRIVNESYVADANLIVSLNEVYFVSDSSVKKSSLVDNTLLVEKTVAVSADATISTLSFIEGDYLYYYNTDNELARVNINLDDQNLTDEDYEEQRVSAGAVSTSWYAPELVTVGSGENKKTYVFYCDESTEGASYTGIVDLAATVNEEKEDDEVVGYYLSGATTIRVIANADAAAIVDSKINEVSTAADKIELDVELADGKAAWSVVKEAREAYDALNDSCKKLVSEESLETLKLYEKAVDLANEMKGLVDFDKAKNDAERDAFSAAYQKAKSAQSKIGASELGSLKEILPENYNWYFQQAEEYFDAE